MKNKLLLPFLLSVAAPAAAVETKVASPDGRIVVTLADSGGRLTYAVSLNGQGVVEPSRLGLTADFGSLAENLTVDSVAHSKLAFDYALPTIKQAGVRKGANRCELFAKSQAGLRLAVEFVVEDDAVAFRYSVPRQGETGSVRVLSEQTEFRFPQGSTTFLTPQSDAMIGWKRTKPSYEEEYAVDAPMGVKSAFGHGFTFPCLFKVGGGRAWALVCETGVSGRYCASRLADYADGAYSIAYPMADENNGNGTPEPAMSLPGHTPWRTIAVGDSPMAVAEQTVTWDVVEPQFDIDWKPDYGKGTWSWILWQDASINQADLRAYVDFARQMGYPYALVDNWWDTNLGRQGVEDLVRYAKAQGVDVVLWYSSSGYWNDIVQGPTNLMDRAITRKEQMRWMKSTGVKGIKVDFFGGDKQETMRLYEDILSDAADNNLFVIFHGATLPRGWERMYPNYVGSEAVLASENLIFDQHHCDIEARSATLHPFIRNAVGCMEYGGSFLNRHMSRDNKGGNVRRTSQVFSLATAVAFQNPMQFFALAPNNLTDAPAECIDFLKAVPTTWEETRVIDGYPGSYVVLARKSGGRWWFVAINGTGETLRLDVALPFAAGETVALYNDGKTIDDVKMSEVKVGKRTGRLTIAPNGAVVMVGKPSAGN